MKFFLIAQMQKVFAFFLLFAAIDASFSDGIVSQSITNSGSEPIVSLISTDKSYYLEKALVDTDIEANNGIYAKDHISIALNSQRKTHARSGNERHRFVLPVVKLTTAYPEY